MGHGGGKRVHRFEDWRRPIFHYWADEARFTFPRGHHRCRMTDGEGAAWWRWFQAVKAVKVGESAEIVFNEEVSGLAVDRCAYPVGDMVGGYRVWFQDKEFMFVAQVFEVDEELAFFRGRCGRECVVDTG